MLELYGNIGQLSVFWTLYCENGRCFALS